MIFNTLMTIRLRAKRPRAQTTYNVPPRGHFYWTDGSANATTLRGDSVAAHPISVSIISQDDCYPTAQLLHELRKRGFIHVSLADLLTLSLHNLQLGDDMFPIFALGPMSPSRPKAPYPFSLRQNEGKRGLGRSRLPALWPTQFKLACAQT